MTEQSNDLVVVADYLEVLVKTGINVPSEVMASLRRLQHSIKESPAVAEFDFWLEVDRKVHKVEVVLRLPIVGGINK
jgi:hypothetical protein